MISGNGYKPEHSNLPVCSPRKVPFSFGQLSFHWRDAMERGTECRQVGESLTKSIVKSPLQKGRDHTVVLTLGDSIKVGGEPGDIALYTAILLELIRTHGEEQAAKAARKEMELLEKFGNMSIEDLMKQERDEGE